MKCPNCGAELLPDVRICLECGCDVPPQTKHFCPSCGNVLSENAKFCPNCGTNVSSMNRTSKVQSAVSVNREIIPSVNDDAPSPDEPEGIGIEEPGEQTSRKPWKKYILIGIAVVLLLSFISRLSGKNQSGSRSVGGQSGNSANINRNTGVTTEARTFELYIDLHSDDNLFFSTYDMDIFLDGDEIGIVADGEYFSKLIDVSKGKHTISIYKSGDHSLKAEKELSINGPTTFTATISHTSTSISFKKSKITDNVDGSRIVMINTVGMILADAENQLREAGFVNVLANAEESIHDPKSWIVLEQNIEVGTKASKNDSIELKCISIDKYYENLFSDKSLSEAQEIASEQGLSLSYIHNATLVDLDDTINALPEAEKQYWTIEYISSNYEKQPVLYLYRHVRENEVETPVSNFECKGKYYTEIEELFKNAGFTNVKAESYYDELRDLEDAEVNQVTIDGKDNFYRGEVFDKDAPIVIIYFLEEDESEQEVPSVSSKDGDQLGKLSFTDKEVIKLVSDEIGKSVDSDTFEVKIEDSLLTIYFYPEGFTVATYNASVLGDKTAIKEWNSLVESTKSFSKSLKQDVHQTLGRNDLSIVIFYCNDIVDREKILLCVMDGVVYYDVVNNIDNLG